MGEAWQSNMDEVSWRASGAAANRPRCPTSHIPMPSPKVLFMQVADRGGDPPVLELVCRKFLPAASPTRRELVIPHHNVGPVCGMSANGPIQLEDSRLSTNGAPQRGPIGAIWLPATPTPNLGEKNATFWWGQAEQGFTQR